MKKCLVVVDYQNDFVSGSLGFEKAKELDSEIANLIEKYHNNSDDVVFTLDTHYDDYMNTNEGKSLPVPHCIKGTKEAELVPELKVYENLDNTISIEKNSTSFNEAPAFRTLIDELVNLERIDEVGVCTDICDFNGIMGLANRLNQENRNVFLNIYENAIKTFDEDARQEYVKAAKLLMKQQGINIIRK